MRAFAANVQQALLEQRNDAGHWEGHLSSSALATATAIVAIGAARQAGIAHPQADALIDDGIRWLVATRTADGGWGDTPDSVSNLSTTALVWSALAFGNTPDAARAEKEAADWVHRAIGSTSPSALAEALVCRYGKDRTFSVPILTTCAIAGRLGESGWALIPQLPFELAAAPRALFATLQLPVVSYALPALISMGVARHRRGPRVGALGVVRAAVIPRVLRVLGRIQPNGGGFLEAVPLTAFVTMSLVAASEQNHPVVESALQFLMRSVRDDGSWPIDTNLATWVTTGAVNAGVPLEPPDRARIRDWLVGQQWTVTHPYTGAAPGGWAWTDLPGGVPDADDTAGAVLALRRVASADTGARSAAVSGIRWLLDLQNRDGGIPTFCRGWGTLPFDQSATDLTAHALRAWSAWYDAVDEQLRRRIDRGIARAIRFLESSQRADGAFVPLWFGNQHAAAEENPVYGTSRVISGLSTLPRPARDHTRSMMLRATQWLTSAQNADGSWGGNSGVAGSIEETALAIEALTRSSGDGPHARRLEMAFAWLESATAGARRFPSSPIGLYFARLWYSERLYPMIFTATACEALASRKNRYEAVRMLVQDPFLRRRRETSDRRESD